MYSIPCVDLFIVYVMWHLTLYIWDMLYLNSSLMLHGQILNLYKKMHNNAILSFICYYDICFFFFYGLSSLLIYGRIAVCKKPPELNCTGPLVIKRTDALLPNRVTSRSCEIGCYNDCIALQFDRHFGSAAADVPVKSLNPNVAAWRLH